MTLEIGTNAPDFEVKSDSGKDISLSDFKGKNLVIYFYPKDNTPGCTIEAQDFARYKDDFDKVDTVILGVSKDSVKSHCNFIKKQSLNFSLLSDEDQKMCKNYQVIKEKSMFGKKYMGIERSTFLIDKIGKIAKIWLSVKVKGHAEEVLEEAKKL